MNVFKYLTVTEASMHIYLFIFYSLLKKSPLGKEKSSRLKFPPFISNLLKTDTVCIPCCKFKLMIACTCTCCCYSYKKPTPVDCWWVQTKRELWLSQWNCPANGQSFWVETSPAGNKSAHLPGSSQRPAYSRLLECL